YGCEQQATVFRCLIGRATFDDALTRSSWRFFAGSDRWTDNWRQSTPIMNAAPMLSVHWNDYLGQYLAVYSTPLVNTVEFRTAPLRRNRRHVQTPSGPNS